MIVPEELERQVLFLLSQNRKIEAVKLVVDTTHCGLKNAKDYVDSVQAGKIGQIIPSAPPLNIDAKILELLARGNKLEAVKLYKDATGAGLAESKDYVEALQSGGFKMSAQAEPFQTQKQPAANKRRDTQIDKLVMEQGTKPKSGCFVATVCYGDYDAAEVLVLRQFRDQRLMPTFYGRAFVQFYYAVSPFLARQIDKSVSLKKTIRKYMLNPIVKRLSGY